MPLTTYPRLAILEQWAEELGALVPETVAEINVRMPTRNMLQAPRLARRSGFTLYVIELPGAQPVGRRSAFGFVACPGGFIVDYRVGIIGVSPMSKDANPQDIVVPLLDEIYALTLANTTRTPTGGAALALDSIPVSDAHTAREKQPRVSLAMVFAMPFEMVP